ncbi:Tyrosine-protein kinase [Trema orientale]|uniref:Tyrosine-protein kinase n=1 Tax=Trema orientale TaxID=63057 RepID=A0A2P5B258_TREOI|nr:Tyrosine-protein kinase [Trema orientale]
MGSEPSRQGDVYSYGILLLEMFTGRRPTDEMFKDDFKLHSFLKMALPKRLVQIVDSSLLAREVEETTTRREQARNYISNRMHFFEIGLSCSEESPNQRMSTEDVPSKLQHIIIDYKAIGIHQRVRSTG